MIHWHCIDTHLWYYLIKTLSNGVSGVHTKSVSWSTSFILELTRINCENIVTLMNYAEQL